ncbi:MAG: sugar kinase [Ewingella americana]|jgi:2-dehydro-3-deoxygluconokinase|uniref:sugar kinase n=1 Tax=Ewingella americana TaxID=41202 RepID=UPI0024324581|nr:sugar kinase [Ewingella americana]MCI1679924.1 sugar kinase [Ewingella americana]MCI1855608.1 sugar kinase [Ewingella americana]MCI1862898.1 sugar kinase [Ewingella americana]MCI2140572.1 sugar kinase [Ewingella americana]MCI2165218.1 sugar kinase [Ewingella americana]
MSKLSQPGALDVVTVGEAMAMFVACETGPLEEVSQFTRQVAGAELNVAIGLSRLGLKVGWASRVGDDVFGRFVLKQLEKEQINAGQVTVDNRFPTGFQLKSKELDGKDPRVEYFRKGSAASHLSVADFNPDYFGAARHLHLSGVAAALSDTSLALSKFAASEMRKAGKTISFDPNLRPVLWSSEQQMRKEINALAFAADWVLPGLGEGQLLTGQQTPEGIADFYLEQGVKAVVIKIGPDGAWFKSASGEQAQVAACKVENVVDTVGAGDGFAVGLISALLEGLSLEQAVKRGNKIGSLAVQAVGDSEGLPTREQLDQA